jgi:hypothetical protein
MYYDCNTVYKLVVTNMVIGWNVAQVLSNCMWTKDVDVRQNNSTQVYDDSDNSNNEI